MNEIIAGLCIGATGIYAIAVARTFPLAPAIELQAGLYPQALGILLVLLAGLMTYGGLTRLRQTKPSGGSAGRPAYWKTALTFSGMLGYLCLLPLAGFGISTFIFLVIVAWLFGSKLFRALAYSFVVTSLLYLVFRYVLQVPLPGGIFF